MIVLTSASGALQLVAIVSAVLELRGYKRHRAVVFRDRSEMTPEERVYHVLGTDPGTGIDLLQHNALVSAFAELWQPGRWAWAAIMTGLLSVLTSTAAGILAAL